MLCAFYDEYMTGNARDKLALGSYQAKEMKDSETMKEITTPDLHFVYEAIRQRGPSYGERLREYKEKLATRNKLKLERKVTLLGTGPSLFLREINQFDQQYESKELKAQEEEGKIAQDILSTTSEYFSPLTHPIARALRAAGFKQEFVAKEQTLDISALYEPTSNLYDGVVDEAMLDEDITLDASIEKQESSSPKSSVAQAGPPSEVVASPADAAPSSDNTPTDAGSDAGKSASKKPLKKKLTPYEKHNLELKKKIARIKHGIFGKVKVPVEGEVTVNMYPMILGNKHFLEPDFRLLCDFILRKTEIPCIFTRGSIKLSSQDPYLAHQLLDMAIKCRSVSLLAVSEKACGLFQTPLNADLRGRYLDLKSDILKDLSRH